MVPGEIDWVGGIIGGFMNLKVPVVHEIGGKDKGNDRDMGTKEANIGTIRVRNDI